MELAWPNGQVKLWYNKGVMNERRNTACISNAANASFCVITRKRTTAIAPTQAVMCIGGSAFVKSAAIIAAIVRTRTPTVNQPRQEEGLKV